MTLVPIVDEHDNIIDHMEREDVDGSGQLRRIASLWLTNSHGEILLAKRSSHKKHHPNKWGFAVAGAVEKEESYEETIRRELGEELGIYDLAMTLGPKFITRESDRERFYCQYFFATKDIPRQEFHLDPLEVAEVRWFTVSGLLTELEKVPDGFLNNSAGWKEWITNNHPF
ncbi:MAG: NUDIX domain-containing protein [Patescibacteria group bacterium]